MKRFAWVVNLVLFVGTLLTFCLSLSNAVTKSASASEEGAVAQKETKPLVASKSEVEYCTPELKAVLKRVLQSCGLIGGGRRGCQPDEVKNIAQISDEDFNALFKPLSKRGGLILFDIGKDELDDEAKKLIEDMWADRRGASYFFIVARASTDGPAAKNRALSHRRANSILFHLQQTFKDPDMEKQVGLLWLGEEFAQLGKDFCEWRRNRPDVPCKEEFINRSAVISWIDCRL